MGMKTIIARWSHDDFEGDVSSVIERLQEIQRRHAGKVYIEVDMEPIPYEDCEHAVIRFYEIT